MTGLRNDVAPNITVIPVGSQLSTANLVLPGMYFRKRSRIVKVHYIDNAVIGKDPTNHSTLTLQSVAQSPVVYAALDTSDSATVANTPLEMVQVTGLQANAELDVPAGTILSPKVVNHGSAINTLAVMVVEWYPL